MLKGALCSNGPPDNWWQTVVGDLSAALARANVNCDILAPERVEDIVPLVQRLSDQSLAFFASFNFRITHISELALNLGRTVFPHEFADVPPVVFFLDHPAHEAKSIKYFEYLGNCRRHLTGPRYGVMDQDHVPIMLDYGVSKDRVFVFPQGGPPPCPTPRSMAERPIDFIFHGSIPELETDDAFFTRLGIGDPRVRSMMTEVIEQVLRDQESPYRGAKSVLERLGFSSADASAQMAVDIDRRARALRRWTMLSALRDLNILYCGNICESFQRQNPNGKYLGYLGFAEVCELVRSSKIMLNETINLRNAALFRLHYAMADGCVIASQKNAGLARDFQDRQDIVFLSCTSADVAMLKDLVADIPALQSIADQALATHAKGHLWDHRLGAFLNVLQR